MIFKRDFFFLLSLSVSVKKWNRFLCVNLVSCYLAEFISSSHFCLQSLGFSGTSALHFIYLFIYFVFLGLHPWHMEVPMLGVKLELQLPPYTTAIATPDLSHICNLCHSLRQHWILNPLSEARDQTHILTDTMLCS